MRTLAEALQWCVSHGVTVQFLYDPVGVQIYTSEMYDSETLGFGSTFLEAVQNAADACGDEREYTDEQTGVHLLIKRDNPAYPDHPLITITCPESGGIPFEEVNEAITRLSLLAGLVPPIPLISRIITTDDNDDGKKERTNTPHHDV